MAIISSKSFTSAPKKRGPLMRVEISPGRFVKMYREDAIAAGHIAPPTPQRGEKNFPPAENKMRRPAEDKLLAPAGDKAAGESAEAGSSKLDDFTTIAGVGPATARALRTRGIMTFEQLRQAALRQAQGEQALDYVSQQAMQAIERWRENG